MMDEIAKNNRDVDSNPRGVLGSCVDAGLGAGPRCRNPGRAPGRAGCWMNHPDPLARCWPGQGRAGVGFVLLRIRPGPPWSILCLLGGMLLCWGGKWALDPEEEEGMRMDRARGAQGEGHFLPLAVTGWHRSNAACDTQTAPAFGALGLVTSLVLPRSSTSTSPHPPHGSGLPGLPQFTRSSDGASPKCCRNSQER